VISYCTATEPSIAGNINDYVVAHHGKLPMIDPDEIEKLIAAVGAADSASFGARLKALQAIMANTSRRDKLVLCATVLAPFLYEEYPKDFLSELQEHMDQCIEIWDARRRPVGRFLTNRPRNHGTDSQRQRPGSLGRLRTTCFRQHQGRSGRPHRRQPVGSGVSREWGDDATRGTIGRVDSRLGERECDGCCGCLRPAMMTAA
jgi:hypothetical protein